MNIEDKSKVLHKRILVSGFWPLETDFLEIPYTKVDKYISIAVVQLKKLNAPVTHINKFVMYQRWH